MYEPGLIKELNDRKSSERRGYTLSNFQTSEYTGGLVDEGVVWEGKEVIDDNDAFLCWLLIDVVGLNYKEAQALINVPMGTLKTRLGKARRSLKDHAPEYWYGKDAD